VQCAAASCGASIRDTHGKVAPAPEITRFPNPPSACWSRRWRATPRAKFCAAAETKRAWLSSRRSMFIDGHADVHADHGHTDVHADHGHTDLCEANLYLILTINTYNKYNFKNKHKISKTE
jgi:hypothetical protein